MKHISTVTFYYERPRSEFLLVQTEAERRRRESQTIDGNPTWVMYVCGWVYVWYLELSREPKHAAQQMRYQNVYLST